MTSTNLNMAPTTPHETPLPPCCPSGSSIGMGRFWTLLIAPGCAECWLDQMEVAA